MKAIWIVIGSLVLVSGCGLFTPIEELQRQARERNGSSSNVAGDHDEEIVSTTYIASPDLHPKEGQIFLLGRSELHVCKVVVGGKGVDVLASDNKLDSIVIGIKSFREYVDGERLARGKYRYIGRYQYCASDGCYKTVRVFEEIEDEE